MIGRRSTSGHSARDDISRLLDPSYNTSYYNRNTTRQNTYGAYVDAHGDVHDPDYRLFPLIPKNNRLSSSGVRQTWDSLDHHDSLATYNIDEDDFGYNKRNSYPSSARYSPHRSRQSFNYSSYRSSSPSPRAYTPPQGVAGGSPISTFEPSSSSSSSIISQSRSPFETEDSSKDRSRCRITALKRRRRESSVATLDREHEEERAKLTRRQSTNSFEDAPTLNLQRNRFVEDVQEEDEEQGAGEQIERRGDHTDRVPTCAESLKKQWQVWSLKIRFGMFKAERNLKRRVQSLI